MNKYKPMVWFSWDLLTKHPQLLLPQMVSNTYWNKKKHNKGNKKIQMKWWNKLTLKDS